MSTSFAEVLQLRVCGGGRFTSEPGGIAADRAAFAEVERVVLNALAKLAQARQLTSTAEAAESDAVAASGQPSALVWE